jgi:hypothetical protein
MLSVDNYVRFFYDSVVIGTGLSFVDSVCKCMGMQGNAVCLRYGTGDAIGSGERGELKMSICKGCHNPNCPVSGTNRECANCPDYR